jgi:hypothetical protein
MALSVKQLLLSVLFVGFAIAALLNHERAYMLEFVKFVAAGTLVFMAYGVWANSGESRAYCAGFLLWGGLYYLLFVVIETRRIDLGTDMLLVRLGRPLDHAGFTWALYEKTGHLLVSLLFGVVGSWVTVYFYRQRQRMVVQQQE